MQYLIIKVLSYPQDFALFPSGIDTDQKNHYHLISPWDIFSFYNDTNFDALY